MSENKHYLTLLDILHGDSIRFPDQDDGYDIETIKPVLQKVADSKEYFKMFVLAVNSDFHDVINLFLEIGLDTNQSFKPFYLKNGKDKELSDDNKINLLPLVESLKTLKTLEAHGFKTMHHAHKELSINQSNISEYSIEANSMFLLIYKMLSAGDQNENIKNYINLLNYLFSKGAKIEYISLHGIDVFNPLLVILKMIKSNKLFKSLLKQKAFEKFKNITDDKNVNPFSTAIQNKDLELKDIKTVFPDSKLEEKEAVIHLIQKSYYFNDTMIPRLDFILKNNKNIIKELTKDDLSKALNMNYPKLKELEYIIKAVGFKKLPDLLPINFIETIIQSEDLDVIHNYIDSKNDNFHTKSFNFKEEEIKNKFIHYLRINGSKLFLKTVEYKQDIQKSETIFPIAGENSLISNHTFNEINEVLNGNKILIIDFKLLEIPDELDHELILLLARKLPKQSNRVFYKEHRTHMFFIKVEEARYNYRKIIDKTNSLRDEIKDLIISQEHAVKNNGRKNNIIKMKISFLHSLIEYLTKGTCTNHKGKYGDTCIEDVFNIDIRQFTNRLLRDSFDTIDDSNRFKYHESRRL